MSNLWVLVAGTGHDIEASQQIADHWELHRTRKDEMVGGQYMGIRAWTGDGTSLTDKDVIAVLIGLWWKRPLYFDHASYTRLAEALTLYRVGRAGLAVIAPDLAPEQPFIVDNAVWAQRCQPILDELAPIRCLQYSPSSFDLWSSPDFVQIIQAAKTTTDISLPQKVVEAPASVFLSYSHRDEDLRDALHRHLRLLERTGLIQIWYDRKIVPGDEWAQAINTHLYVSDLILLLVSADFFASDYCMAIEVPVALDRHNSQTAQAVPVILRPVLWDRSPLAKLQALPKDAKPVTSWSSTDLAFVNICEGVVGSLVAWKNRIHFSSHDSRSQREGPYSIRKRVLDAAMPGNVEVGRSAMLILLIRKLASAGLRALVSSRPVYGIDPKDVQSTHPVSVRFPIGPDDRPEPLSVSVVVQAPDFEPPTLHRSFTLDPNADSQPIIVMLSATKSGDLRVIVELHHHDQVLVQCVVPTSASQSEVLVARRSLASAHFQIDDVGTASLRKLAIRRAAEDIVAMQETQQFSKADALLNEITAEYPEDRHVKDLLKETVLRKERHAAQLIEKASDLARQERFAEALSVLYPVFYESTAVRELRDRIERQKLQKHKELEDLNARLQAESRARAEAEGRSMEKAEWTAMKADELSARERVEGGTREELARRVRREAELRAAEQGESKARSDADDGEVRARPPRRRDVESSHHDRHRSFGFAYGLVSGIAVLALLAVLLWLPPKHSEIVIASPASGSIVGQRTIVRGKGWYPRLHNYLVASGLDVAPAPMILGLIRSSDWAIPVVLGDDSNVQSVTQVRIYVLSTSRELDIGAVIAHARNDILSGEITVTVRAQL